MLKQMVVCHMYNSNTTCGPPTLFHGTKHCADVPFSWSSTPAQLNTAGYLENAYIFLAALCYMKRAARNGGHPGLGFMWISTLFVKTCAKHDFHISAPHPSDLDLWAFNLRSLSSKFERCTFFCFFFKLTL